MIPIAALLIAVVVFFMPLLVLMYALGFYIIDPEFRQWVRKKIAEWKERSRRRRSLRSQVNRRT